MFKKSIFLTLIFLPFFAQSEVHFTLKINDDIATEWNTPLNPDEYPTSLALSLSYQTVMHLEVTEASFTEESASFTVNMYLSQGEEEEKTLISSPKVEGAWNETVAIQVNIDSENEIVLLASLQNN